MFDAQIAPLIHAGYRVLTWDIRGHGQSKPIGRLPIRLPDMVDDLLALLDFLGERGPICVGGQSLGGYIAQEMARRAPECVKAMVIIGSTSISAPISRLDHWALKSSPWWFVPWPWGSLKRLVAKSTALRPDVRAYAQEAIGALSKPEFLHIWRAVASCLTPDPGYRIAVPHLLTHGDQDRTGNVARTAPAWAAREKLCHYRVVPNASHNANQDNPEFFNQVMLDFLAEHYRCQAS